MCYVCFFIYRRRVDFFLQIYLDGRKSQVKMSSSEWISLKRKEYR